MLTKFDRICLARIRARNADMHRNCQQDIVKNTPLAIGARIFTDEKWFIELVDRLTEGKYQDDAAAQAGEQGGPALSATEMGQMAPGQIGGSEEDSLG